MPGRTCGRAGAAPGITWRGPSVLVFRITTSFSLTSVTVVYHRLHNNRYSLIAERNSIGVPELCRWLGGLIHVILRIACESFTLVPCWE